jgi:hypothetical protein
MLIDEQPMTCVRATYEESELRFEIPRTATLEQLATMLAVAGRGHGVPVVIEIILQPDAARG